MALQTQDAYIVVGDLNKLLYGYFLCTFDRFKKQIYITPLDDCYELDRFFDPFLNNDIFSNFNFTDLNCRLILTLTRQVNEHHENIYLYSKRCQLSDLDTRWNRFCYKCKRSIHYENIRLRRINHLCIQLL
jgi:hypothetical protein